MVARKQSRWLLHAGITGSCMELSMPKAFLKNPGLNLNRQGVIERKQNFINLNVNILKSSKQPEIGSMYSLINMESDGLQSIISGTGKDSPLN